MKIVFPDAGHCTFPMGHVGDKGFRFCAEKAEASKPYCAFHCSKCFKPPEAEPKSVSADTSSLRRIFGGRL